MSLPVYAHNVRTVSVDEALLSAGRRAKRFGIFMRINRDGVYKRRCSRPSAVEYALRIPPDCFESHSPFVEVLSIALPPQTMSSRLLYAHKPLPNVLYLLEINKNV